MEALATTPRIVLDGEREADKVVTGRGWVQVTPAKGARYYERAEVPGVRYESMTAMLTRCWPGDFTGPMKAWMAADACSAEFDNMAHELRRDWIKASHDRHLDLAAARGTALHDYVEARLRRKHPAEARAKLLAAAAANGQDGNGFAAAVDAFMAEARPEPELIEVVCFDTTHMVAGTVDFVGTVEFSSGTLAIDWKSRGTSHTRRTKEAAQVGGYLSAVCGRTGYYLDDRGREQTTPVYGGAVVTFRDDGSWAFHEVDTITALGAYDTALAMRDYTTTDIYDKAHKGAPLDVAAIAAERLAAIADGPERSMLAQQWTAHRLPKVAELGVEHWVTVDTLLTAAEPFAETSEPPTEFCTHQQAADLMMRVKALPGDLRELVARGAGGLPPLDSVVLSVDDAEDWERLITPAESAAAGRRYEADLLLDGVQGLEAIAVIELLGDPADWADAELERCAELVEAIAAGDLILDADDELIVSPRVVENLPKLETRMKAKAVAEAIGRPTPKRFDDAMCDVVLYAATRAA